VKTLNAFSNEKELLLKAVIRWALYLFELTMFYGSCKPISQP